MKTTKRNFAEMEREEIKGRYNYNLYNTNLFFAK